MAKATRLFRWNLAERERDDVTMWLQFGSEPEAVVVARARV